MSDNIVDVETFGVCLPYRKMVAFGSVTQDAASYVLLRLRTESGAEGIAEAVARPEQSAGEDAGLVRHVIDVLYKPLLIGADPICHENVLQRMEKIPSNRSAKALIDTAIWDLRGKLLNQPVWRLLGGGCDPIVPLTWVVHRASVSEMVETATEKAAEGYRGLKLKIHANAAGDLRMVREVRMAVGDDVMLYVDANGKYAEGEARALLNRMVDYNVTFAEDPCNSPDPSRQAAFAQNIPMTLLGDRACTCAEEVLKLINARAVGAVNTKVRRAGITESLRIIDVCRAAGLPVILGTDSASRVGALARLHLRAAIASLDPWPTETFFFNQLADDAFVGDFKYERGTVTLTDAPGFGASLDMTKMRRFAL
ncbi:MAG: hypothetical protein HW416_1744 [Chloroflexi bacterium]|nr:hypothetical protein [Chloroflexota bacterium]